MNLHMQNDNYEEESSSLQFPIFFQVVKFISYV